jgi:hypothetical protein
MPQGVAAPDIRRRPRRAQALAEGPAEAESNPVPSPNC